MQIDLTTKFPIPSQTSDSDKRVLLTIQSLLGSTYSYLEIGII
jgi:hypothetical protein